MASGRDYLTYITEQLSGLPEIRSRAMMSEYILYYRGKVFGGIYDNRFLVKETPAACKMLPDAQREIPYAGAKPMLLVPDPDDRDLLEQLIPAMYEELPEPKARKKGSQP